MLTAFNYILGGVIGVKLLKITPRLLLLIFFVLAPQIGKVTHIIHTNITSYYRGQ